MRQGSVPLSAEIGMWHAGKTHAEAIVDSICRSTHLGVEWQALLLRGMTHARYEGGVIICDAPQRDSNSPCARHFLLFVMDILKHVTRSADTDHEYKVMGKKWAWWGKQHEPLEPEVLEERMSEKQRLADIHGTPQPQRSRVNRQYVPVRDEHGTHQQHGIAGRADRCVRQIGRYAEVARKLGLFRSHQPRVNAPDAVKSRHGSWAYPEWIVLKKLPEGLLKRLRYWWGELTRAGKPVRQRAGEPPRIDANRKPSPRGPPQAGLLAVQPDDDLHRALGLSLTELDDIEQHCGL